MTTPSLGLIHTYASLDELHTAAAALRGDWIKVVPAWWPHGPAALAALPYKKVIRTSWGDPSYANGARAYPLLDETIAEVRPYVALIPDAVIEIGNEPSGHGLDPHRYNARLVETVRALRHAFPSAKILPPAHSPHAADRALWLQILAPIARECHALTIHGYSDEEVHGELRLIRQHVSASMSVWLTEVNYGRDMTDADRAANLLALFRDLPGVEVALLYHLDTHTGDPLVQQGGAFYRLKLATLQAIGAQQMIIRDVRAELAHYRTHTLKRGSWTIGRRERTTAQTLHWNGPAIAPSRLRGAGVMDQLRADVKWQTEPGWAGTARGADGLQYHTAVDADGVIYRCRDEDAKLWHCGHATGNAESLSLHLLLGRGQAPTEKQWRSTVWVMEDWRRRYNLPIARSFGHMEWTSSECPGLDVMRLLREYRGAPAKPPPAPSVPVGMRRFVVALPQESRSTVRQGPSRAYAIAGHLRPGHVIYVDAVLPDERGEVINGQRAWAHMALVPDQQTDLGFVHLSALREQV
jgi:hypothetical protein